MWWDLEGKWSWPFIFINLFEILEKISKVAYKLALLASMDHIQNVFYVSLVRKYVGDPSHVLRINDLKLIKYLLYEE